MSQISIVIVPNEGSITLQHALSKLNLAELGDIHLEGNHLRGKYFEIGKVGSGNTSQHAVEGVVGTCDLSVTVGGDASLADILVCLEENPPYEHYELILANENRPTTFNVDQGAVEKQARTIWKAIFHQIDVLIRPRPQRPALVTA